MIFKCPSCNKKINKKSEYCMYCGCNINLENKNNLKYNEKRDNSELKNNIKINKPFLISKKIVKICVILLIFIIVIASYFVFKNLRYNQAVKYMNRNDYSNAIEIFSKLGEYRDSDKLYNQSKYNIIKQEIDTENKKDDYDVSLLEIDTDKIVNDYIGFLKNQNGDQSKILLKDTVYLLAKIYDLRYEYDKAIKCYEYVSDKYSVDEKIKRSKGLQAYQGEWYCDTLNWGLDIKGNNVDLYQLERGRVEDTTRLTIDDSNITDDHTRRTSIKTESGNEFSKLSRSYNVTLTLTMKNESSFGDSVYMYYFEQKSFSKEKAQVPYIGMSREDLKGSTWGEPKRINKTTTEYGVREQWCYYGDKYVYVEDDVVTAIQE